MEKQINVYREETHELLAELESSILELEESSGDAELIDRVFRPMHTIKGSAAMFGFENISDFTHHIETVFDLVRDRKVIVDKKLVDLTLAACDQIKRMINKKEIDQEEVDEITDAFRQMIPHEDLPEKASFVSAHRHTGEELSKVSYRIRFRPHPSILESGANPMLLLDELRELGECSVIVQVPKVPDLESLNPETCQIYWDVILTTACDMNAIKDIFIFVEDQCELTIDVIDEEGGLEYEDDYKRLGEILSERGDINTQDLKTALGSQKRVGQLLVETKMVAPDAIESALVEQQHIKRMRRARYEAATESSIRVASEKLDGLVDLVGELVTVQAHLMQKAAIQEDAELLSIAEEVERLTGALRENTMGIRMLPVGTTFNKFKRVVRDLSAELGKDVALVTEGGETELDKTVIERLGDPLVHIIRNCIDHGIETHELRRQAGKPSRGTVTLSAEHSGAHVLISISDDGKGLDTEAIRIKAVEKGLITPDADMSDSDIFPFIFTPGFSTVENVSDLSGRGVGMDVVKRGIDGLRGSVEIRSEKGKGTAIILKLPLTLAIIDGLMVKISADHYVIPLSAVEECIELTQQDVQNDHGRHIVNLRGKIVPYLRLRELFMSEGESPAIEMIVITEVNGDRIGFVADRVLGEHQTVIKGLGRAYKNAKGVSGATILGDGTVALILDLPDLVHLSESDNRKL
ncbi:chemotaxis protein CheA [Desulfococcaceae bacterium HSG7]|nr:chemotaxis protein CheA [Desulfococcaceae bacterium HSG7]